VTIEAIDHGATALIGAIGPALYRLYELADAESGQQYQLAALTCEEVLRRVYVIGAMHVERGHLPDAAGLADHRAPRSASHDLWARHGLALIVNAGLNQRRSGLVTLAVQWLQEMPMFMEPFGGDEERALDRLCQYDF